MKPKRAISWGRNRGVALAAAVLLLWAWLPEAQAQKASSWRVYRVGDGLAQSEVMSVNASPRKTIWAWHLDTKSLSVLDGYKVRMLPVGFEVAGRVYEGRAEQLWAMGAEGLHECRKGVWTRYPLSQMKMGSGAVEPLLPSLVPVRQGRLLLLLSNSLVEMNNEWPPDPRFTPLLQAGETGVGGFSHLLAAADGGLWIAGQKGLLKVSTPVRELVPSQLQPQEHLWDESLKIRNLRDLVEDGYGGVVGLAESVEWQRQVLAHWNGRDWSVHPVRHENVRLGWMGLEKDLWAATAGTLYRKESGQEGFEEWGEYLGGQIHDVAVEAKGTFWLATSEGLYRYAPPLWRVPGSLRSFQQPVQALAAGAENRLWWVSGNVLWRMQPDGDVQRFFLSSIPRFLEAVEPRLFVLPNETLILPKGGRLGVFTPGTEDFQTVAHPEGKLVYPLGWLGDGRVLVQVCDRETRAWRLEGFDGSRFTPYLEAPPALDGEGVLHGSHLTVAGALWVGGRSGLAVFQNNKWQSFVSTNDTLPSQVLTLAEVGDGKLWCGTRDKIWEYDGRNWSIVRAGMDRVNAILQTRDGRIWVASNGGLHLYSREAWMTYDVEDGLSSTVITSLCQDRRGQLWVGTARGVNRFHPEADPDPPRAFLQPGAESREQMADEPVTLAFGGADKWKHTPDEKLLFSYRLDDQEWSAWSMGRSVTFPGLTAGGHYFQVRAMDRNGNVDLKPAQLDFAVTLPWYKERRLMGIGFSGLALALFFAVLAFNNHLRLKRSYAEIEKIVELRTRQLERANRDLLHSQKMTAMGTLAAGIAHDFNNILSIIKGSAQIIEGHLEDKDKIRIRVDRIKTVVDQGAGIVKAMLGFSRSTDRQQTACDLNAIAADTIRLLGDRFLREVDVRLEAAEGLPVVAGARELIQQMILNTVFNAADAMNGHGQILLQTGRLSQLPERLVLAPAASPDYLCLAVKDAGCGIPADVLPRIFEPFFTTKGFSARRGTGLGLSMVYQMAQEMGYGLGVESQIGRGTTFTIFIPVARTDGTSG